jgi:hypothetical protein
MLVEATGRQTRVGGVMETILNPITYYDRHKRPSVVERIRHIEKIK